MTGWGPLAPGVAINRFQQAHREGGGWSGAFTQGAVQIGRNNNAGAALASKHTLVCFWPWSQRAGASRNELNNLLGSYS